MGMLESRRRRTPDAGHLAVATGLIGWCVWYVYDTVTVARRFDNLAMVVLVAFVALLLYLIIVAQEFLAPPSPAGAGERGAADGAGGRSAKRLRVAAMMILLVGYVALLPHLGFDAATFVFVALSLVMQGERRIWVAILYAAVFSAVVTLGFVLLVPFPVPTLLF